MIHALLRHLLLKMHLLFLGKSLVAGFLPTQTPLVVDWSPGQALLLAVMAASCWLGQAVSCFLFEPLAQMANHQLLKLSLIASAHLR